MAISSAAKTGLSYFMLFNILYIFLDGGVVVIYCGYCRIRDS